MSWLLPMLVCAQVGHAEELAIPFEQYELENGLDVILAPDHSTPIVSVNVWYHVGSKDETEGLSGFAHLFEHLMFQGSASLPTDYFEPLDAVGASVNGSTNADRTNYHDTLPAQHLPMALFVESDRMGWLLIDDDKLANQKGVVRNERRQNYENKPYGSWRIDLYAALYPKGHPYHNLTIGNHVDLEAATLEDVQNFFDTWYAPNNASLVIAGDFDPETTKEMVAEYFGNIPAGEPIVRADPPPHALTNTITIRQTARVPEQRVWVAWHSPAHFADGDAELDLLAVALGTGKGSRLYQRLVQSGVAKSVSAKQSSRLLTSTFIINAAVAPGHDTDEVVAIIDEIVDEITGDKPPTDEELMAGRAGIERALYERLRTVQSKADSLNNFNFNGGGPQKLLTYTDRFTDLTAEQLVAAAEAVFTEQRVVLHIKPEKDGSKKANGFWERLFKKEKDGEDAT